MLGIDLNKPITYIGASYRYFDKGENYIKRVSYEYVLLMVFKGVLRFIENGVEYEVHPGEFRIHWVPTYQEPSKKGCDCPQYLYVHFYASATDGADVIPVNGKFHYEFCKEAMDKMDYTAHYGTLFEQKVAFYNLLALLPRGTKLNKISEEALRVSEYIEKHFIEKINLEDLCSEFNYSKNYIIRFFKNRFGVTPMAYLVNVRLKHAEYLLITTSKPLGIIAEESGFDDYSCFYKAFYKKNKLSANEWRKLNQR